MFHRIAVLDLLLPRILTGEAIGRQELALLGHGGLCRNCSNAGIRSAVSARRNRKTRPSSFFFDGTLSV